MADRRRKPIAGLVALIAFSLVVCPLGWGAASAPARAAVELQIEFTPHVTPLDPQVATALAAMQFVSTEEGAFFAPSYSRVPCGEIDDDVCFELCYAGTCHTYGNDDDRVERFVRETDAMRDDIDSLQLARREGDQSWFETLGTCLGAGAGAVLATATAAGLAAPEPLVTKIVGVASGLAALIICGASVYGATAVEETRQQNLIDDIIEHGRAAITESQDLERNLP
jgi:hypothetical protein